jgi:2',3'-cyclic-nucleotide 2'-phosphodiesterase (5'-nucleotidase family)
MKKTAIFILVALCCSACHQPGKVVNKTSHIHTIDSTLDAIQDTQYIAYLAPIKAELEAQLNAAIGYAPQTLEVHQPECTMLNWASDALFEMAKQLCPNQVDMAVVNIGGMRCNWGAGDITFRHVFELMPFDNELVVLTMQGKDILELCEIFANTGGQGVAGLRMRAKKGMLISAKIAGKEIMPEAYYTLATSDYLSQGNDGMVPLKNHVEMWKSEKKIRDLYIEYIEQVKTVEEKVDGRMDITV